MWDQVLREVATEAEEFMELRISLHSGDTKATETMSSDYRFNLQDAKFRVYWHSVKILCLALLNLPVDSLPLPQELRQL